MTNKFWMSNPYNQCLHIANAATTDKENMIGDPIFIEVPYEIMVEFYKKMRKNDINSVCNCDGSLEK